jgi:hypothetical protein
VLQRICGIDLVAKHIVDVAGVDMREGGIGGDGIDHLLFALRVIELPTGTKLRGRNRICRRQALRGGIDERL